jgi:fructose-1,6-bisphosphatase II
MAAVNGEIQCKLWPRDDSEREFALEEGLDLDQVLTTTDLVNSDNTFFAATGVTSGELLDGIRFQGDQVLTHSLVMRSKTLTSRYIEGIHSMDRIRELSEIPLD